MTISFTLTDQLPSGKNQVQLLWRKNKVHKYPNQRFTDWRKAAAREILHQRMTWPVEVKMALPLRGLVSMSMNYRPLDRRTRDVPGILDALCHCFVYCGLLEDDGQVQALDWPLPSRREGPCAVVRLTTG